MKKCRICNSETRFLGKELKDGVICKECYTRLPDFIRTQMLCLTESQIKEYFHYQDLFGFETTSSYGNLKLDDMHGLFAIEEKNITSVFSCLDIKSIALYCTNVRVGSNNKVLCDVELGCEMATPDISFKTMVKKKVLCNKKIIGEKIEWSEPSDLSMFRNMFNQLIKNENEKYSAKYMKNVLDKKAIEAFRAKSLFMLSDDYTYEELEKQYKRTMSAYDVESMSDKVYIDCINNAYALLKIKI